jgi:F-type H+-transporting ATPase subunit gamma
MANLKTIRRRINSVQNTRKITRAMKMVSAAKLRRAQDRVTRFRSYADLTASILGEVSKGSEETAHPLLEQRKLNRTVIVVVSSDRGLCGPFNSNLCREVIRYLAESETDTSLEIVGRRARDFFSVRSFNIRKFHADIWEDFSYDTARDIAGELSHLFISKEVDGIHLAYNEFVSVMRQTPVIRPLLPIVIEDSRGVVEKEVALGPKGFKFEPDRASLLSALLPKYVAVQVYRALVESRAAEHAARMTAMEGATTNAGEMIDHLTLQYNRARQDAITKELMDIVGGAEALSE